MQATREGETSRVRRPGTPYRLALPACLPLALAGALLALAHLKASNTLDNGGRWVATKTTVAKSLIGAESFFQGRQALAGGVLNPGSWHGFHEVLLRDPVAPRSFQFDFFLTPGSYLVALIYDADGKRFAGVRLSMNRRFPNVLLEGDGDGMFTSKQAISPPLERKAWQQLRFAFAEDSTEVTLDGHPVGSLRLPHGDRHRVGFRSGFKDVYLDSVRLDTEQGEISDEFSWPAHTGAMTLAGALTALAAGLALFALLARRPRPGHGTLAAYFGMIGTTLAVLAGLLWAFVAFRARAPHYPAHDRALIQEERQVQREHLQILRKAVMQQYREDRSPGTTRILVLGTSQTWGAGARTEAGTFVATLEDLLEQAGGAGSVQCINGGISAAKAPQLVRVLKRSWLKLQPDYLLINLGNNDRDAAAFQRAIERMLDLAAQKEIEVILVREANSTERFDQALVTNHGVMEQLGAERGVPVLDMHRYLASRRDDGFLWWDKVHLTTFGQRLVAERLAEELLSRHGVLVSPQKHNR